MNIKYLLAASFALLMLLTGCISEPEFEPIPEGGIPINLDGSISQIATRVNAQGFETGDGFGIYAVNYENSNQTPGTLLDEGNQADHVKYVFDESNWKWTPVKPVYYKDVNTNVDLYAFYPHAEPSSVSAYNYEVQKDQSTAEKEGKLAGYEASDFLWGKAVNIAPTESKVKVTLNHMMAGVHVILAEGEGFDVAGDWDLLDKKVLVTNTTRKASIDLSTGEVTPVGGAQATGIVMCPQSDGSFRAIAVPQTVEALAPLFNITVGGVSYDFKKSESYTYTPGKLHTFTIKVNRKYPSGEYEFVLMDAQINDWKEDINTHEGEARQYYCVHCEEPGTLGKLIKADGKNPDKIKNLKVSGKINKSDIYFMRDSMSILQSINLKESQICAVYGYLIYDENWNYLQCEFNEPKTEDEIREIYPGMNGLQSSWVDPADHLGGFGSVPSLTNFVFPEKLVCISDGAFNGASFLSGALVIPDGVKKIGSSAFKGCVSLSSVSLPYQLESIGESAFDGCNGLAGTLSLPSSLVSIGAMAFQNCIGLSGSLVLPQNISYLGYNAFQNCSGFSGDLLIPESLSQLGAGAFKGCSGLDGQLFLHDNLNITSDANYLKEGPFDGCSFTGDLIVPSCLTEIPYKSFSKCKFSSVRFPDGLLGIGESAFLDCNRLSGVLELPESLVSLGQNAFCDCSAINELIIPDNLSVIKSGAFQNCYQLSKILCESIEPPVIQSGAFNGVAKDNFTVEVPANSVQRYQTDPQWGEFKRISAYYDFSISSRLSRTLNSEMSRKYILRAPANFDWSIESKPDWITVTPSSGTGKTEVTVTFAEMTSTDVETFELEKTDEYGNYLETELYAGRAGKVVFLLNDKDYRSIMTVEQYDYRKADGEVMTLNTATKGKGVNIVFMGDCYDARDIADGIYMTDIEEAVTWFFDIEPYKTYKEYFVTTQVPWSRHNATTVCGFD